VRVTESTLLPPLEYFAVLRAISLLACLVTASPSVAHVRVIAGDIQHLYGPGGEVLDDAELQARNERAFARMDVEKQRAIERHQLELEAERFQSEQNFSATQLWR
jgi:hypothetical protein